MPRLSPSALTAFAAACLLCCAPSARAEEQDPASLYELSTTGTTATVKAGGKGSFVLLITPRGEAHVSDEAPLKVELTGKNLTLSKAKLQHQDSVAKPAPRFEVPFTAGAVGPATVDAKITFFICTDKICARQQKTVSASVEVN